MTEVKGLTAISPRKLVAPGPFRARDQERLRAAGGAPHPAAPDRDRARRVRRRRRPGHARGPARRAGRHDRRRARHPHPGRPDPRRWASRATRSTRPCRSKSSTNGWACGCPPTATTSPSAAWRSTPWAASPSRAIPFRVDGVVFTVVEVADHAHPPGPRRPPGRHPGEDGVLMGTSDSGPGTDDPDRLPPRKLCSTPMIQDMHVI